MKKIKKILLSLLAVFGLFFTMTVNAEEIDYKTVLNSLTDVKLDIKESEVDFENLYEENIQNETISKIKNNIKQQLVNAGYEENTSFEVEFNYVEDAGQWGCGAPPIDIHKAIIVMGNETKDIKIIYSNTSESNKEDETYVKNKLNSIKFTKFYEFDAVFDAVVTTYNIGDEKGANDWNLNTFDFNKLFNDNSITIKKESGMTSGGGTPWGGYTNLYLYKNDVLYATKNIANMAAYGTTLENGTPVNMALVEKDDEVYKTMSKELENNGLTNIIGCYELTAYGTIGNDTKVSFNLGTDYNNKEVIILHKKHDNTYETFTTTVVDGKATISVSELSPFMIALSNTTETNNNVNEIVNNAPNNAQTSSLDIVLYSTLAIGSLLGIAYIVIKGKKKVA